MKYLVALIAILITGCTTMRADPVPAKLTIQYATMKFIHNDAARATKVVRIVTQIRDAIDGDSITSIDFIKTTIQGYLPLDLMPEDRLAVNSLIDIVVLELNNRINDADLPPDLQLQVKAVADWIIEAASYYPEVNVP